MAVLVDDVILAGHPELLIGTAALYAFFIVLAVIGWRDWKRNLDAQRAPAAPPTMAGDAAPPDAYESDARPSVRGDSLVGVSADPAHPAPLAGDNRDLGAVGITPHVDGTYHQPMAAAGRHPPSAGRVPSPGRG